MKRLILLLTLISLMLLTACTSGMEAEYEELYASKAEVDNSYEGFFPYDRYESYSSSSSYSYYSDYSMLPDSPTSPLDYYYSSSSYAGVTPADISFGYASLWDYRNAEGLECQVQVPEAVSCSNLYGYDYDSPCLSQTAGWFYGFDYDGILSSTSSVYPYKFKTQGDEWNTWDLALTDYADAGRGVNVENGTFYANISTMGTAGLAFNWKYDESGEDISSKGGICLSYQWTGGGLFMLVVQSKIFGSASYELPHGQNVVNIPWSDFSVEGTYSTIIIATSVQRFLFMLTATSSSAEGTFYLYKLGWSGEC